jgi:hypothetical protein
MEACRVMDFPVDHLSASSITKFLRCPRAWQEGYVYKAVSPSNSSLVIGSAVHLGISRVLRGEPAGDYFQDEVAEAYENYGDINWKDSIDVSENIAKKMLYDYERFGKHLRVMDTEKEISIEIPGVPIPIVGFVDIVCEDRLIDIKTTGYFNRKVELNPEWKLQANVYQLYEEKPCEFHVLTRSKTAPVVVPTTIDSQLYVHPPQRRETETYIRQVYDVMKFYVDRFGEDEWPGNVTHPWSHKYCPLGDLCCHRT